LPSLAGRQRIITPQLQQIRMLAAQKPRLFIEKNIKIANLTGTVVPFKFNWAQRKYYSIIQEEHAKQKPVRLWVVKWRRAGITSAESALGLARLWSHDNARVAILAHLEDRSKEILQNYKFYYNSMAPELQLQLSKDNIFGVKFENFNSQVLIGTCENPIKVRGDGVHWFQGSEAAHWGWNFGVAAKEIAPVVPPQPGTGIIYESTGSIRGCQAHQHAMAAKDGQNEFRYVFLCWLDDPECSIPFTSDRHRDTVLGEMHELEPRLTDLVQYYKLTPEQAHQAWRYYHYQSDNDFDYFCREFPVCEDFAWSAGGASFFGQLEINRATSQHPTYICKFDGEYINRVFTSFDELTKVSHVPDYSPHPNIKVWAAPRRNGKYVIGADSSMGEDYGDYSAGYVIDIGTREMMASFHGRLQPSETAHIMVSLGRIYNNAVLCPESNPGGGGMTVLQDIQRIGYNNIYRWRLRDSVKGLKITDKLGWWTSHRTRPMMLGELRKIFMDCINGRLPATNVFRDVSLISEMRTFVPDVNSDIPRALNGCYDDRVIGLAIAHQAAADESYCTDKDLIHSYHKFAAQKPDDQKNHVQRVKPNEAVKNMFALGGSRNFEILNGRVE